MWKFVFLLFSKIFVVLFSNLRLQQQQNTCDDAIFSPLALSLFYYALCFSGFQHQALFYLSICCFYPESLSDDVSNAATLADGMAVQVRKIKMRYRKAYCSIRSKSLGNNIIIPAAADNGICGADSLCGCWGVVRMPWRLARMFGKPP